MAQRANPSGFVSRLLKHRWLDEADTRKAIPEDLVRRLTE